MFYDENFENIPHKKIIFAKSVDYLDGYGSESESESE